MEDTVYEINSHSSLASPEEDNVPFVSSNSSLSSQQSTPGNQSQTRRRHSLSLRKIPRENSHQSDACVNTIIENQSRQSRLSSMENPSAHSSAPKKHNCEFVQLDSSGQSIGNNTSFRPILTDANHSRSKDSKTLDMLDICRLNSSSQGSHSSPHMSPQHEVAENRLQTEHDHSVLSQEKSQKERKRCTEQHEKKSRGYSVRKSLFDSLDELSSSSTDDVKIVTESVVSCPQKLGSGNVSNVRKTSKLSSVDLTGSRKQEPCSSSSLDVSSNWVETKNIFDNFSHEDKHKTDNYNVATPKLQNQAKETKFATKVVKDMLKQKLPQDAIVIDDSPDRNANSSNSNLRLSACLQENTMPCEANHKASETVGGKPHLILDRTLSKKESDRQEHFSDDSLSQKDNTGVKKQTSSVSEILEHLKRNRPAITKLLKSQLLSASVKQNSRKELMEETVVISSDEDMDGRNESQVRTGKRRESGLSMKTLGLKRSKSTPSSQKHNSATDVKESWKCSNLMVTDSLNSSGSFQASILETFPALIDSSSRSSLSTEISYQGEIPNENNANKDSEIPSFVTIPSDTSVSAVPSDTSVSSMPSLQRKESSIYRNSSSEECSPPMLSQYPVQSPTSLHLPEVICLVDSPSPVKNIGSKPASVTSYESMFTECSMADSHEDNLNGKLIDLLDIIDTTDDNQHSVGTTQSGCGAGSKIDPLLQASELNSPKPSYSESSARRLNVDTDLKVAKERDDDSALRGNDKMYLSSEIDKEICILDSEDEFSMDQSFDDTHCLKRQESDKIVKDEGENSSQRQEFKKIVKDGGENRSQTLESEKSVKDGGENCSNVNKMDFEVLAESNYGGRTALNQLNANKEISLENESSSRIDAVEAVCEESNVQNDLVPAVCTFRQHCEQEPSAPADFNVVIAVSPGEGCQTSDAAVAVVKKENDGAAFTGAADASMYSEINDDLYILDSDDDEFFMSQSVLSNHSADKPADGESSQTADVDLPVVKEDVDDNAFTGAADASLYSEINDEIYILDSDDDEYFMTQSILNNPCSDKEEDWQNSTENEKGSEMRDKFSLNLFENGDKMAYNKQQSDNDNIFVKDAPDCSSAVVDNDDLSGFDIDSDENDRIFDAMNKETTVLAPLPQENFDEGCSKIAKTGNIDDRNEPPYEVNDDDLAKSIIDDFNDNDDDDYFLSQMDSQIDYTTHSGDEFEDTEVECREDGDGAVKSIRTDRNSPVTFDGLGASFKNPESVEDNSESSLSTWESGDTQDPFAMETQVCYPSITNAQNEYNVATLPISNMADEDGQSSVSTCESGDTQDPFAMETQVCYPSATNAQNEYNVATLPISNMADEDAQVQINREMHATLKISTKRNLCHKSKAIFSKTPDHILQGQELPVSPLLHVDTQDPFSLETQQHSDELMKEHDSLEQRSLSASTESHVQSAFTMETQQCFERDDQDTNLYNQETQALSPTSSDNSEYMFAPLQTQIMPEPDVDGRNKTDRDTAGDSLSLREDKQMFPGTKTKDSFKQARNKQFKNDSQTSALLLNDGVIQGICNISRQEKDQQLAEDDAFKEQTHVFSTGKELQNPYNIATQKNVQSESSDDLVLLNDDDTQDHFDLSAQDDDHLLSSSEDNAYEGQTQEFPPDQELETSYNIATQKNMQSEAKDEHANRALLNDDKQDQFDLCTQVNHQSPSEKDSAYAGQTQAFSPDKDSQSSYDVATQKNFPSESSSDPGAVIFLSDDDTQDHFNFSTQVNEQLQSDDDYTYGGQTQAFSPGKDSQSSHDIATQKNVTSESSGDPTAIILLNDQAEEYYAYGGQTQVFSLDKDSQKLYDTAAQKNIPSEADNDHLFDIQTLADSTSLNDATQNLVDEQAQNRPQSTSNDKYIYEMQTLANSPLGESETVYNMATQIQFEFKDIGRGVQDSKKGHVLSSVDAVMQDPPKKKTKRNQQAVLEDRHLYEQETLARSQSPEIDDFYSMQTQNTFQQDRNNHALSDNEMPIILSDEDTQEPSDSKKCHVLRSVDAVMQDPPKKNTKRNQQAVLEDRHLYEQETLAKSQSPEIDDFYNMQTQNTFQRDRNNHALSDNEMSIILSDESSQEPNDCETRAVHLASEDRHPCERVIVSCQDEDCQSLYSKSTQKMCQQEGNSSNPYTRETFALSPTMSAMFAVEKSEYLKSSRQSTTVGEKRFLSLSVDTHDSFEFNTDFPYFEDQDEDTSADSPSERNIESHFLTQTQKALSPVREHSISTRETAPVPTCSHGGDTSSRDSECSFMMKTQKDSSPLATDQDPYTLQTQIISSSFHEDSRDPFSIETLIDSPAGLEIASPYDRKTLDTSVVSEDSQDPFSLETELDTSSFEERSSVSRKTALATSSSSNKEVQISHVAKTQYDMSHLQTLVAHKKTAADLSVIGSDTREGQIQRDLIANVKSNVPLPTQDNLLKYSKDHTYKDEKPFIPEATGDPLLPGKSAQSYIGGNINCTQNHGSKVYDVQANAKNSDNAILPLAQNILQSIGQNSSTKTSLNGLIERLQLSISQKVQQPFKDDDNSIEQDYHSPYFAKGKQNSPTDEEANITESCGRPSPISGALELSVQPRQNFLLSEPQSFSRQPCEEDKAANRFSAASKNSSHSEVYKRQSTSLQEDNSGLEGYVEKKVSSACDIGSLKNKFMPVSNGAKNVFSSPSEILPNADAKELSAHIACMTKDTSSSTHPLQQDLTQQHHKEKVAGLSENNLGFLKRPAENGNETSGKRKCMPKDHNVGTAGSYGIAGKKRSKENDHDILSDSKRLKINPAKYKISENKWITVRKGNNNEAKHNKATTVTKNTSKLKRPRSCRIETTKGTLTTLVESAKQMLKNRRMEARSAQPINDGKVKILTNDDNDDVVMPSTQDMMSLGLPILSAKLPVSKKHLASGLPSQGRVASDDKQLQDKNKPGSSENHLNGFCDKKNSIQKETLPSVPLFNSLTDSKNVSSSTSSSFTPAQSAVTLETPASSLTSSKESKEPSLGPSLVMSNCHTASGSETSKLISQTHTAVIQPAFSASETSATETVQTSSTMSTHSGVSIDRPGGYLIPALMSETVYSNGPTLPTLPGTSKQSAIYSNGPTLPGTSKQSAIYSNGPTLPTLPGTSKQSVIYSNGPTLPGTSKQSAIYSNGPALLALPGTSKQPANTQLSHQGILKGSKPPELNHYGEKVASKVTFKDPYEHPSLQRREVILPHSDVSQLKEIPKCKPELKLYFLATLLHWNPVWLKEKEAIPSLPALFGSRKKLEDVCCQLRMYYSRFDEYVGITLNLLILECWETIYKDWKMCSLRNPFTEVHCTRSPWQLYKEKEGQSLFAIEVTGLVTQQNRSSIPSVGNLLIMNFWGARKLQKMYDEPRWCTQFAYVKSVSLLNNIRQFMQTHRIFESSKAWGDIRAIAVNMTLILQHRGDVIMPTKLHGIQVISSLKTIDRQIDALVSLPESPLCMQLLNPTPGGLFTYKVMQPDTKLLTKLNREQASAVATIVQDVRGSPRSQEMFLLQGPPGTGKSHTMLALIHQILIVTHFKGRICLAAPSNAAVDEMAKRIINFSHKLKNSALESISLVRVGNKARVHPVVKPFMLEDLVEKILTKDIPDSLKSELSALEKAALTLERALSDQSLPQEQRVVKSRKQREIQTKIFKLKEDIARKKKNPRERYNAICNVLDKAQIICGTLSSLGSEDLKEIVLRTEENPHKRLPFTCLIIDEATQAIEVDCLIPLQYKMNKVVLVGDTEQLPATVLSQMANEKQLARSLFERMDFCIKQFPGTSKSPVMMLTRQYRMHNEILYLPNSFFYEGQLVTDESVLARKELIAPYLVFDIQESKESRGANTRSVSNEEEAVCIAQLCEIVSKKIDKIGVICPYTDQQQSILGCLRQRNLAVEVNTVDSFQGQEREVIILSCVRAQSNPSSIGFLSDRKRMNVALTRARVALYVIGHFETLKTDELWEELYKNAVKRNLLVKVPKTPDFKLLAENAVYRLKNYSANGS